MREAESPDCPVILEIREASFNAGDLRFVLSLAKGELAVFEVGESVRAGWLGDAALGLVKPMKGEVRFLGADWGDMLPGEAERRRRRRAGRVLAPEEGAVWLQNLDLDENIQLAQRMDPEQRLGEVAERALRVARRFGLDELPRMRPAAADRRTLQVAQWVRAFLPKELSLLILDRPLRGASAADAVALRENMEEARERGAAVVWVEEVGAVWELGLEPDWHFPEFPAALRQAG